MDMGGVLLFCCVAARIMFKNYYIFAIHSKYWLCPKMTSQQDEHCEWRCVVPLLLFSSLEYNASGTFMRLQEGKMVATTAEQTLHASHSQSIFHFMYWHDVYGKTIGAITVFSTKYTLHFSFRSI